MGGQRPQQDITRRSCPPRFDLNAVLSSNSQRQCLRKFLKQHRVYFGMKTLIKGARRVKEAISNAFTSCVMSKAREPVFSYANVRLELRKDIESLIREIPVEEIVPGEEMDRGANGSVGRCGFNYHAEHVAVKRITIRDWSTARAFIHEVNQMARAASHSSCPRLVGWAVDGSKAGIIGMILMECLDDHLENYFDQIHDSKVPSPSLFQRIHLMIDYATALHYLHDAQNVVHGDIHLRNLMIKNEGQRVRGFIVDLGLSRNVDDKTPRGMYHLWTAPETMQTGYTRASEVFSFGLVMLSLIILEKRYPRVPHCPLATVDPGIAIQWEFLVRGTFQVDIPDPTEFDRESPPAELIDIVKQCLSPQPDGRPTIGHVCRVLMAVHQVLACHSTVQFGVEDDADISTAPDMELYLSHILGFHRLPEF